MLGINIMSYSSILDVLLSPVVHLASSRAFPIFIILIPAMSYFMLKYAGNNSGYVFYIEEGTNFVSVTPVSSLLKIEKIKQPD